MANVTAGKSKEESKRLAGYSNGTIPTNIESCPNLRKALIGAMELNGLTSSYLGKKIRDGVDARKKVFSSFKGEIKDERIVDDNETQHKYVRTALEVRGDLQENQAQVNIGIVEIPTRCKSAEEFNAGL